MAPDHPAPLTPERLLCRQLARTLHPFQLRELIVVAEQSCAPAVIRSDEWRAFVGELTEVARSGRPPGTPSCVLIAEALDDRSVRDRVKVFLRMAAVADPVDALLDAELVTWLMRERLEEILREPGSRDTLATPAGA
jgi:hypothetical protein